MNRLKSVRGGTGPFNLVSVTIYILIILSVYVAWKYGPVYIQRERLSDMVGQAILGARRESPDQIKDKIIQSAEMDLGLKLNPDTFFVEKSPNYIEAEIFYDVTVNHPFGISTINKVHVLEKRSVIDW